MRDVRRGDEHRVHQAGPDQVIGVGEELGLAGKLFEPGRVLIAKAGQFHAADAAVENVLRVSRAHVADADDPETNDFHRRLIR